MDLDHVVNSTTGVLIRGENMETEEGNVKVEVKIGVMHPNQSMSRIASKHQKLGERYGMVSAQSLLIESILQTTHPFSFWPLIL